MIIAYHVIWTTYGTWLPNDPRGSYSLEIYNQELRAMGSIQYGRQNPQPPRKDLRRFWTAARPRLSRAPFFIDDRTRPVVAAAIGQLVEHWRLAVRACSIMNDHVHVLVMRSRYRIEYLMNRFKGVATRALGLDKTPWTRKGWKVFISDQETLRAAARYIEMNPICVGMVPQQWDFVTPFSSGR